MRDVRRAYRRNFARFVILLLLTVVLCGSFFAYTREQAAHQQAAAHRQCEQRRASLTRANTFYHQMAVLEESNRFIDQSLRDKRIALYRGLVYPLPHC